MKPEPQDILESTLSACRRGLAVIGVFSLFANLLMLAVPLYMLQIFDRVLTSRSVDTLLALSLIVAIALLALASLEAARGFCMIRVANWLDRVLASPLLAGSIRRALSGTEEGSVQPLRDLATFKSFLTGPTIIPFMDGPWTPVFVAVIFLMNPLLGWIALGGTIAMISIALVTELLTRRAVKLAGRASATSLSDAEAAVRSADAATAMGMAPTLVERWCRQNDEVSALQGQASRRVGAMSAFSRFVRLGLQVAMLGAGAWLVIGHEATAGIMIAGSILLGRALAPVEQGIVAWRSAVQAREAYRRLRARLIDERPPATATRLPTPSGRVGVRGMSFVHRGARRPAVHNISFALDAGESLAILGPSAAGKSTLARLLVGTLKPASGHVRLDGADVAGWPADSLRRHIGYLPQDVALLNGTIRENIARMETGDSDKVVAAARLAGVHETILALPDGYETAVGGAGLDLSGGERQRIAIARALYDEPKFVVLDEPGTGLDQAGEAALMEAIAALRHSRVTTVLVTHQPNMLSHVDKVLILRDGRVRAFGAAGDVLARIHEISARGDRKLANLRTAGEGAK